MKISKLLILTLLSLATLGCQEKIPIDQNSDTAPDGKTLDNGWAVKLSEVADGGVGKDGIRSIDDPVFVPQTEVTYIEDAELVMAVKIANEVYIFPHKILDYHEVVNMNVDGEMITISYCPLTGTGLAWAGKFESLTTQFGVSGLLYNNNLILYDRQSDNNWSQMRASSIFGDVVCTNAVNLAVVETNWSTWKQMGMEAKVLSTNTGVERNYNFYPYGSYRTDDDYVLFPLSNADDRLPGKERVMAVIDEQRATVVRFNILTFNNNLLNVDQTVVVGNQNLMLAYSNVYSDGTEANLTYMPDALPAIMSDVEGNVWDIFGEAIEGPRKGQFLKNKHAMMAYWFSLSSVFDEAILFK